MTHPRQFCEEALWNLSQIKNYVYYLKINRVILAHLGLLFMNNMYSIFHE